jgi:hypothetical protein
MHLAQHQRLPQEKLFVIIKSIYDATKMDWFIEPSNDDPAPTGKSHKITDSKRTPPGNTDDDCRTYWKILDNIASADVEGVGATFNSLKKNTFPNLESMGLLRRENSLFGGQPKKAQLTELAEKFLTANSRERTKIFSECNENILKPMIQILDLALERSDTISVYEMMLFLTDESITVDERLNLVSKYKRLGTLQVIQLHSELQNKMNQKMGSEVPKTEKLDWHNWWNESKQITTMLNSVVGFNVYQDELIMKVGNAAAVAFSPTRSQQVRKEALVWQSLAIKEAWDLHHIVPVEYATSSSNLKLIDDKKNLLYIPQAIHKKIPRTSNLFVEFSYDTSYVYLKNPLNDNDQKSFVISWPRDAGVSSTTLDPMVKYNKELLALVITN